MKHSLSSKLPSLLAGLVMMLGTGCASRTVQFNVVRPAMMNLQPAGNTLSVGTIQPNGQPEAAADVTADLQFRIVRSLNPSIRLLSSGAGAVEVDGTIVGNGYEQHTETVSATCSRTVDDGVDANGTPQSHTESYDCSYNQEVGTGTSTIQLRVVDSGSHRVLFNQVYLRSGGVINPSKADVANLMHGLRGANVEQFAKVILPWRETVAERFKDCDGDDRCKKGIALVKTGDLAGADALFSQVIGGFSDGGFVPEKQTKQVGEAFYDRAVIRAHQELFAEAVDDMGRALKLQPKRAKWPQELVNVQQLARDKQALRAQGAAP